MSSKYQNTKNIYLKEKVDTIALRVPKGEKAIFKAYAEEKNKSLNSYILDLIYTDIGKIPAYTSAADEERMAASAETSAQPDVEDSADTDR